jgi:hypothetical protein
MTLTVSDISSNSPNKRQTTVTMKQIFQKWLLLQNIKDSSLNRNGVFNYGEWTYSAVGRLPIWSSFNKNFQI